VTTTLPVWTRQDSAELTAELIVAGAHMPAKGLDDAELRATVELAHRKGIRRAVIAARIGWKTDRLWQWCDQRGITYREDDFPVAPMTWARQYTGKDRKRRP
jgi:hypothetical protein